MPKTKGPRNASKQASSKATELGEIVEEVEDPQNGSNMDMLEQFERKFAFKLKLFDKLLEEKLAALDGMKERLKIKYATLLAPMLEASNGMDLTDDKENVNVTTVQTSSYGKCPQTESEVSSGQGLQGKQMTRSKHKNKDLLALPHSENAFKTPAITTGFPNVPVVTPKIAFNTPISMLRLPRQGEMALSLSGSPVMVSAMSHESKPNLNIPLNGEQVLSLIPHERFDPSCLPELDEEAREQLEALHRNLQTFISITSSNRRFEY